MVGQEALHVNACSVVVLLLWAWWFDMHRETVVGGAK